MSFEARTVFNVVEKPEFDGNRLKNILLLMESSTFSYNQLYNSLNELKRLSHDALETIDITFSLTKSLLSHLKIIVRQYMDMIIGNHDAILPDIKDEIIGLSQLICKCIEKRLFAKKNCPLLDMKEIDHLHAEYMVLFEIGTIIPEIDYACIESTG